MLAAAGLVAAAASTQARSDEGCDGSRPGLTLFRAPVVGQTLPDPGLLDIAYGASDLVLTIEKLGSTQTSVRAAWDLRTTSICSGSDQGEPVVYFSAEWLRHISLNDHWRMVAALAHQIGHIHNDGDTADTIDAFDRERAADRFVGRIIFMMKGSAGAADASVQGVDGSQHGYLQDEYRVAAVVGGWQDTKALLGGPNVQHPEETDQPPAGPDLPDEPELDDADGWIYLGHYESGLWKNRTFGVVADPDGEMVATGMLIYMTRQVTLRQLPAAKAPPAGKVFAEMVVTVHQVISLPSQDFWAEVAFTEGADTGSPT